MPTPTPSYEPAVAMRKALAIVSATLQREHQIANDMVHELDVREARFAVAVVAEYLSQTVHQLALCTGDTADDIWQQFCMSSERAIQIASDRSAPPR